MSVKERDKRVKHLLVHCIHLLLRGMVLLLHRNWRSKKQRHVRAERDGQ